MQVFITGISSDIGNYLAENFLLAGDIVSGTCRQENQHIESLRLRGVGEIFSCDFSKKSETQTLIKSMQEMNMAWDVFISSVGTMQPIAPFVECDMQKWLQTQYINTYSQLELLHGILELRRPDATVMFWAGGGTNNPFTNYSAYCISKIILIKMCELLYDEIPDTRFVIAGPGMIATKIHEETLRAGKQAGLNYQKTKGFLDMVPNHDTVQNDLDRVYRFVRWVLRQPTNLVSGRNFAIMHDKWEEDSNLLAKLSVDVNMYKLRRQGNDR